MKTFTLVLSEFLEMEEIKTKKEDGKTITTWLRKMSPTVDRLEKQLVNQERSIRKTKSLLKKKKRKPF